MLKCNSNQMLVFMEQYFFLKCRDLTLSSKIEEVVQKYSIDLNKEGSIFIARDTRKSSPSLCQAVLDGISCLENNQVTDFGLASTPVLHYLVVCKNGNESYGKCSKEGYYSKISAAFCSAIGDVSIY